MQFRSVKVGEWYKCWPVDSVCDPCQALEKLPSDETRSYPEVVLRDVDGYVFHRIASNLEPWDKYLEDEHQEALRLDRILTAVQQMNELVGGGILYEIYESPSAGNYLRFSESAAEAVLALCGAKPLPEDRRPSRLPAGAKRSRLQTLLSTRLARALGCGHGGEWLMTSLRGQNTYMARLTFEDLDFDQILERLRGDEARPSLGALLASV